MLGSAFKELAKLAVKLGRGAEELVAERAESVLLEHLVLVYGFRERTDRFPGQLKRA